uniref:Putative secreted peptide n=1 Tax=Anopheles braziliensis TaxID=58242 RepID=A0A2M3ZED4_9DIPT
MNSSLIFIATIAAVIAVSAANPLFPNLFGAGHQSSSNSSKSSEDSETPGERFIGNLENIGKDWFQPKDGWQFPGFPSLNPWHPRPTHGFGIGVIHRPVSTITAASSTETDAATTTTASDATEASTMEAAESTTTG